MQYVILCLIILIPILIGYIIRALVKKDVSKKGFITMCTIVVAGIGFFVWFLIPTGLSVPEYDDVEVFVSKIDPNSKHWDQDIPRNIELTSSDQKQKFVEHIKDLSLQKPFFEGTSWRLGEELIDVSIYYLDDTGRSQDRMVFTISMFGHEKSVVYPAFGKYFLINNPEGLVEFLNMVYESGEYVEDKRFSE